MTKAHPWMANSVPEVKQEMLAALGLNSVDSLFSQIPEDHLYGKPFNLPPQLASEVALSRHLDDVLSKNATCKDYLCFLGAGAWPHYVPAICDEVANRYEWQTSVFGSPTSDHGRNQAWFEFCSQIGALVEMDFVGLPVYSWGCAIGHSVRMASRMTGRRRVLIPEVMDPERLMVLQNYCEPREMARHITIDTVRVGPDGQIDRDDLQAKLGDDVCALYIETPSYHGVIDADPGALCAMARASGAEAIVGVDPLSLGLLEAPGAYGATIAVGPTQPMGVHMNAGGGVGGFIASPDEARYTSEYNTLNISIGETQKEGEYGFGLTLFHQSSYGMRDEGKDWTGNSVYLWALANTTYMAAMGPEGFAEIGRLIMARSRAAAEAINALPGASVDLSRPFFKEFVVQFDKPVAPINDTIRTLGIFGGKDITGEPGVEGHAALYCVTEIHTPEDIAQLTSALKEALA
ncbi:aminomethyl-transferring glycine dehydrogenase subunit GcvPA [Cognatishimia sp. F0-27]|uniref:aminomethyl-transferring glycine dehydrogenase subunit GcvPA n=1 Tax=Cognatishimia sp. F0-27 TaxID=2816855 RepID=UPI001D0C569D|nr:aminomethyl-transferring glycine dehydrogenase subunit GcvPA [Cognatishimia sp. F0-27]MCC1493120.1 aminomethyl-transferring glycine dehydrogenase subunit GcvPA [Cognatishimia sp. F0-27]